MKTITDLNLKKSLVNEKKNVDLCKYKNTSYTIVLPNGIYINKIFFLCLNMKFIVIL